jgi:glutamyl-tRNA synthetase
VGGPAAPYRQLEREGLYREHVRRLVQEGKAYHCTCTAEELAARREAALKAKQSLRHLCPCRAAGPVAGRPAAVRFHVADRDGVVAWEDLIQGRIEVRADEIDDFIIQRSDARETPVYNFAAVVDDALMGITHVVRGADHIPNTPRQILLYGALGYRLPAFGHIPLVLGSDREKLSKRHGDVALHEYRTQGYLPEALVNYLVRLGWAHGDQEVFTREELLATFQLERVHASPGVFDRVKLDWLNGLYIRQTPPERLADLLVPYWDAAGVDPGAVAARGRAWLLAALSHFVERARTLVELARAMAFLFRPPVEFDAKASAKFLAGASLARLREARALLAGADPFSVETLEAGMRAMADAAGTKLVDYAQPIRVALTGSTASPPIFPVLVLLGREAALARLDEALTARHGT